VLRVAASAYCCPPLLGGWQSMCACTELVFSQIETRRIQERHKQPITVRPQPTAIGALALLCDEVGTCCEAAQISTVLRRFSHYHALGVLSLNCKHGADYHPCPHFSAGSEEREIHIKGRLARPKRRSGHNPKSHQFSEPKDQKDNSSWFPSKQPYSWRRWLLPPSLPLPSTAK
jgi:hypothetical protein